MVRYFLLMLFVTLSFSKEIVGYGGTFLDILVDDVKNLYEQTSKDSIRYTSIGSVGAIKQLLLNRADFVISDINLTEDGFITEPLFSGNIAIAYNINGVDNLNLTPEILGQIYSGSIKFWDDEAIKIINKDIDLKHDKIRIFHRYDGSGTTLNFTKFIADSYDGWELGSSEIINFKVGIGKRGNFGIANAVKNTPNSIGYTGYSHAKDLNLTSANLLINQAVYPVSSKQYPMKNYTFFIYKKGSKDSQKFLNFIINRSGDMADRYDFYPFK